MSELIDFSWDLHVHSSEYSDDATSTIEENIAAARLRGVKVLGLADHVRKDSLWLPGRDAKLGAEVGEDAGIEILRGVEAKIDNAAGNLDLPRELVGIDYILIADHRYPGGKGPVDPAVVRELINEGVLTARGALNVVVGAIVAAVVRAPELSKPNVLAHPFSLLLKIGLDEGQLSELDLARVARVMAQRGTLLEVNEKWSCPSGRVIAFMAAAGVALVGGSDAHRAEDVGVFDRSRLAVGALLGS